MINDMPASVADEDAENLPFDTFGDYWGTCPECGSEPDLLNIERDHWAYCPKHKTKWLIGGNLFSSWHGEDEATWRKNHEYLAGFDEVRPQYRSEGSR